ncbi:MAG: DUF2339 domain-containing protein [Kiritimatiellae bacterium]|nr:DUF2339 domain-containing protein [Kiritimatiellia bacterium]
MYGLLIVLFIIFGVIVISMIMASLAQIKQRLETIEQTNLRVLKRLSALHPKSTPAPTPEMTTRPEAVAEMGATNLKAVHPAVIPIIDPRNFPQPPERAPVVVPPPLKPPPLKQSEVARDPAARQEPPPISAVLGVPKGEHRESKFAASLREIFRKIWCWILVGEEYQPKGMTTESAVASTWLMRVGIIFITALAAYFLKWSMARELIGPAGRFAIGIGLGVAMLISGIKLIRTHYKIIGQGLLGGGIVVLYLAIYAADAMYHIMPTPLAFALMALVTLTAGFLAIKLDSMLVAIFGIIGGYLTPIALPATVLSLPGFYSYLSVLSVAVLVIALVKQWRLLNYLGFVLTYGLYFFYSMEHYDKTTDFPVAIFFLTLLFVLHSLTVCLHNIVKKQASTILEAIHLILNALVYATGGYFLIAEAHGRPYPALMALGLALFHMLYISLFLRRGLKDRLLLLCLISLAAAFTAWTLPLILKKESLTIALALLAFVFLWLGRKVKSNFLQSLSYLVYGTVYFRVLFMEMPGHYNLNRSSPTLWSEYFAEILDRFFTFGASIGSVVAAFLLSKREARESSLIFPENDIAAAIPAPLASGTLFWVAVTFVFLFLNLELNAMFLCWNPIRLPMLTLLWGAMVLFLFSRMRACERAGGKGELLFALTIVFLVITLGKLLLFDSQSWNLNMNFIYNQEYLLLDSAMRLFDFGILVGVIMVLWRMIAGSPDNSQHKTLFGYLGLALFFLYASLEVRTLLYWKMRGFMPAGLSILWSVFAISFIVWGITRRSGVLRALGLALFVIVCGKITLFDLRGTEIIYRVIALLIIAVTLLLGSFAYLKSSKLEGGRSS